jgi:deoxyribonuclease-2
LNDSSAGALTHTTKQLWHSHANYVIYNDQVPPLLLNLSNTDYDEDNMTYNNGATFGHTKGFFAFNTQTNNGFWITHSIPLFPIGPANSDIYTGLGSNAKTYAQHMLCLSMTAFTLNELAGAFMLNRPQIYDYKLTVDAYTLLTQLVNGKFSTEKRCDKTMLTTRAELSLTVYSKTAQWNDDLYSGCVAPYEKDTIWVESWIRGSAEGPTCPDTNYDTLDINYLDFSSAVEDKDAKWSETQDHSKWLVTKHNPVICMGDINRMTTQYMRGGGTTCFNDPVLHSILKEAATETDTCTTIR